MGLALGMLIAVAHLRWNLGILYLLGLCLAAAVLPLGLRAARLPVAFAVWLGQYSMFWWHVIAPARPRDEMVGILYIINGIAIFMPAVAVLTGTYLALVLDRNRICARRGETPSLDA